MKVAVTGATGLIGRRLVAALLGRGDEVVALSRSGSALEGATVIQWDPLSGPAPAVPGVDGVVHLAGEPIAQRWTDEVKQRIRASRVLGTENLVSGLEAWEPRPKVLVSTSAAGFYGDRGSELLEESARPGPDDDFLASVCVAWETAAGAASDLGVRVVVLRNGVVLDRHGGALARMLGPFRAALGGPVAGGRQYLSWIAVDDTVGLYLAALDGSEWWSGPINACSPAVVTNAEFARALGRALHRPAVMPLPGFVLRIMFGEMSSALTASQRMVPARAVGLGYEFQQPELAEALEAVLSE
jgi:uncharacterized protein (TIGR01777 family)